MRLEIAGQSVRDASNPKFSPSRLLNLYTETGGDRPVLRSVLGSVRQGSIAGDTPRAMSVVNGTAYVVQDEALWCIASDYSTTRLGGIPDGVATTIDGNNGVLTIAANGHYFVWDGTDFSQPGNLTFANVTDVVSFGQRTVLVEGNGRRVQWSNLLDPKAFSGLDFATTESGEDFNLRAIPLQGSLWIFKERSIEQWYATATGIAYINGSKVDVGLKARNLVVSLPNAIFWVSEDGKARLSSAGVVSTVAVEEAIESGSPVRCVYYRDKGNEFACIVFSDRPAWCFNLTTQSWHERREGASWQVRDVVQAYGSQLAIDVSGDIRTLERVGADPDRALVRQVVTRTLEMDGRLFRIPRVEFPASTGEHEATLQIETSRDRGRTWRGRRDYSFGDVGDYDHRIVMRSVGQYRTFNLRLSMSEPVDAVLGTAAYVDVAP